jgi:hypothetical protein
VAIATDPDNSDRRPEKRHADKSYEDSSDPGLSHHPNLAGHTVPLAPPARGGDQLQAVHLGPHEVDILGRERDRGSVRFRSDLTNTLSGDEPFCAAIMRLITASRPS